jgi:hypothetical protein
MSVKRSKEQEREKARADRHRCREWLIGIMREGHPKFCTKAEFFRTATAAFGVSKAAFDAAWAMAIEDSGRHDWYEPLRRGSARKS